MTDTLFDTSAVDRVLGLLQGVKDVGSGKFSARCPSHEDRVSSLSIAEGDDGKILLKCHAGCAPSAVIRDLGLEWKDLFKNPAVTRIQHDIKDHTGQLVAHHHRERNADGTKGPVWWTQPNGTHNLGGMQTKNLPLYGAEKLPGLPDGTTVILTEGEPARDALETMGIHAVGTITGAASNPSTEILKHIARFRVILWPDNDEAGGPHMRRCGAILQELGTSDLRWLDWKEAPHRGDAVQAVTMGVDINQLVADAKPFTLEPTYVDAQDLWPAPIGDEAYHGIAGEIVSAIAPHSEADPVALLLTFLAAAGSAMGRSFYAQAEGDRHGTNIFCVLVGDSSKARKGSSFGRIKDLMARVDPMWAQDHITTGLSSGEGFIHEVRDPYEKETLVKGSDPPRYVTEVVDAGVEDKRLLLVESEFVSPLKMMAREGNTLSAIIRQAFDSGTLRTMTKSSPTRATDAHISIIGHVTRDELLRNLSETESGNGFANRFLWVCAKRGRVLPEGGGQIYYGDLIPRLHGVLVKAQGDRLLARDADAKAMWALVYEELSEGKPGLLGAVTARAEAIVLRLSVLYASLDGDNAIRVPHLLAALAVWEYCEASSKYIFGDATGDSIADKILIGLRESSGGLTRTAVSDLLNHHVSAKRLDQALNLLQRHKKAACHIDVTDGHPAERWKPI